MKASRSAHICAAMRSAVACARAGDCASTTITLMHGAVMSDSEKPARIDTASDSDSSAARAASMARCIAPVNEALRSVCAMSGSWRQRMCGWLRPASSSNSRRPACSPVSYMSTCG
ncbi:hypothetical protein D9M70_625510 [compost metagenome]